MSNRPAGMYTRGRLALLLSLALTFSACATQKRIVAFGDIHGDLEATRAALRLAGAIDGEDRWAGGPLVVVQTGDQLDRGDDERAILDLFERLRVEAQAAGGAFHALLGNHELMNVRGDLRYVTEGGFADFAYANGPRDEPFLAQFEEHEQGRMAAFMPGGTYARLLAERSVILKVGSTVFVHGGVLPEHVAYGVERINKEAQAWLRGEAALPEVLAGSDSPQWVRLYSRAADSVACETLAQVLDRMDAERMVVGHTVQEGGIASACEGRAWLIDVGMAEHYGGTVEVLEIDGDLVRALGGSR